MGRTDLRPDITKEVLEEYIRKGYSQNRIAITLGTTQSTIFNKLKKYGLQVQKTRPSNYDEKALIKQLQNGMDYGADSEVLRRLHRHCWELDQ